MAKVKPFRAVRPTAKLARDVASHAYDVVNREEASLLVRDNPLSFLRVEKSEINLPDSVDPYSDAVYDSARDTLREMIETGVLIQDESPCFYVYRQQMGDHSQSGIVACVDVEEYETGRVKRHEMTRADKETDRTRHVDRANAQTGPVFLAYRQETFICETVARIAESETPEYHFNADDGTTHSVWVLRDPSLVQQLEEKFDAIESLYIADGHHRAAAAAGVARMRRQSRLDSRGDEEFCRFMAVIFSREKLQILPYNRVVRDLAGMTVDEFLAKLSDDFIVEESRAEVSPTANRTFGMYVEGRWFRLALKNNVSVPTDLVRALDVSILQDRVLGPMLKIGDVRSDDRIDFVGGIRGVKELERLVDSGQHSVGFSLYATDMESLLAVSDQGQIMPPKSTWFEPKLKSGLFVHLLD